ncbi:hypothetical protein NP493_293g01021 [Ridgeia piscesae]|uniref:Uncharacterized protein n=1 Tax=Ridgeia piscesae TaxID=27915 RepID=A0AAD9NWP8_RIDPI|nr:hypothetical protein NP493_293g01021 [Ridgeia piscesae]
MLLECGADVNLTDDRNRTSLMYACEMRCNDVIKILLKTSVNPDIADIDGNTALLLSAAVGNDVAIEILIRCFRRLGLNVDHVNNDGLTALMVAAKNGFIQCATTLAVDGRACISCRDPESRMNAEEWARSAGCSTPEVLPFSVHAGLYNYRYEKINSPVVDTDSCSHLTAEVVSEAALSLGQEDVVGGTQRQIAELSVSGAVEEEPIYSAFRSNNECDTPPPGKAGNLPSIQPADKELFVERRQEKLDSLPSLPKIRPRIKDTGRRSKSTGNLKVSKEVLREAGVGQSAGKTTRCQVIKSDSRVPGSPQTSDAGTSYNRGISKAELLMDNGISGVTLPASKRNATSAPTLNRQHSHGTGLASASRIELDLDS